MSFIIHCQVCGSPFDNNGIGRPKSYCSASCADFAKYLNAMSSSLSKITFSTEKKKQYAGEFFRLANQVHNSRAS